MEKILLPGLGKQLDFLSKEIESNFSNILIIGSASEAIANNLALKSENKVELIVEDYESLINSKLLVDTEKVNLKLMEFDLTDFKNNSFDFIYAQASISSKKRNKIVKELKRISKENAVFCIGEIVALQENPPPFVENIFEASGLAPLFTDEIENYYTARGFEIVKTEDFSSTLIQYYSINLDMIKQATSKFDEKETSYYKKLANKISHESKAYLKQGADKFIGFKVLILKKGQL